MIHYDHSILLFVAAYERNIVLLHYGKAKDTCQTPTDGDVMQAGVGWPSPGVTERRDRTL